MGEEKLITVCDLCFLACCWQGIFMCENAQTAGTVQKTIAELQELQAHGFSEHPSYWLSDEELEAEATAALERISRR